MEGGFNDSMTKKKVKAKKKLRRKRKKLRRKRKDNVESG